MRFRLLRLLAPLAALIGATSAQAVVSCWIAAVDPFTTYYDALLATANDSNGTLTVTCSRSDAADPTAIELLAYANDGSYAQAQTRRANAGAVFVNYDLFSEATRTTRWGTQKSRMIPGALTFGAGVPSTQSAVLTYWTRIPALQTGLAAGTYTDSVAVGLDYTATVKGPLASASEVALPVQILNLPHCLFANPPQTVAFQYTAFSPSPVQASSTFAAQCSTNTPYTVSLSDSNGVPSGAQTRGVVAGLQYTLTLSAGAGTGSGNAQFFTINGSMPAGQAGTCSSASCVESKTHTLTITY